MDYLTLGPTPYDEVCTPNTGDKRKIALENDLYKRQLKRMFQDRYKNVRFCVKTFPHDFGSYSEVCAVWTDDAGAAEANEIDQQLPDKWDAESLEALATFAMKAP